MKGRSNLWIYDLKECYLGEEGKHRPAEDLQYEDPVNKRTLEVID